MDRKVIHIIFHFFVPFAVAKTVWQEKWTIPFLIMALKFLVD
tara:strand:+ start:1553 stop:1678 length:126 start_codon:yes stop_codon:yes gene_type:complete